MEIRKVPVSKINPAPYNPRKDLQPGDPEFEKLKMSIHEFGFVEPLVWNKRTGNLVGGHQRFKILTNELGLAEVEVSVVDLDETREKALNIALNKIEGGWDLPKLKDLLLEIDTGEIDIEITGFDQSEIEQLMAQFAMDSGDDVRDDNFDVDKAVEEIKETVTKPGDVLALGDHRVLCGDATSRADILRLMNGKTAQMVFTDPPYNVDYEGKTKDALKIKNDKMDDGAFYDFLLNAFRCAFEVTAPGGAIYICHADSEGLNFRRAMADAGWLMKQTIIWVKNAMVMGRQDYQWKHEPILYGWKPGAAHAWYGGRRQTTVIESGDGVEVSRDAGGVVLTITSGERTVVLRVPSYEVLYHGGDDGTTVWRFDKPTANRDHPTMKPIPLVARAIQNSSRPGDLVFDPFLGSGTTLIAAEQTGRVCYGLELDPIYCDVIIRRWEEFTGKKAVRMNGAEGRTTNKTHSGVAS